MPFNGSGSYVPPGPPIFPPTAGSVISSSYFTSIINDMSSALSLTFLRDGSVPLGGNVNFGGYKANLLGSGSVASPSINFTADATSGIYFVGTGIAISGGGTLVASFPGTGAVLTGVPTAPTAAVSTNTTQLATTAFVLAQIAAGAYAQLSGAAFTGLVSTTVGFYSGTFTSGRTIVLPGDGTNSGVVQFTRAGVGTIDGYVGLVSPTGPILYVSGNAGGHAFSGGPVSITGALNVTGALTQAGNQVWHAGNLNIALYATLASPALSGTPTAPTAAGGTNTTQLATTAFVQAALPSLTGYAPLASPALTGTPTAPTAAAGTNTTQLATTAFVVTSYAPLVSPALTGTPTTGGNEIGTRDLPQTAKSAAYTMDLTMRGGHTYYTGPAAAATIPPNSSVLFPIGTAANIVNNGSGALTLTRGAGVALNWNGSNANRTLAAGGMATLLKVATDTWFVSGTLLS